MLAYLGHEPGGARVAVAIQQGSAMSAANLAEVLSKLVERGDTLDNALRRLRDYGILGQSVFVFPLDEAQATEIARLRPLTRAAGLSLADRACLALAKSLSLPVLTADRAWSALQLDIAVEVIR
jgi:ribonuclease VapC